MTIFAVLMAVSVLPAQEKDEAQKKEKPAAESNEKDAKSEEKEDKTEEKKKDEKKELKLSGVFVSEDVTEIILRPEAWSSLKVKEAAAHGTKVGPEDVILQLETEDIDRKIEDLRRSQYAAGLSLKLAQEEMEFAEKTFPMDRKIAERTLEHAKEDLEYYLTVTLPNSKESAERSLQNTKYRLEYTQEELDQLQKMYKEDDITEETEEIILLRAKRDVEEMKQFVERAEERTKRTLNVDIPRQKVQTEENTEKTILQAEKDLVSQEINLRRKQHDLDQQQIAFDRTQEQLEELVKDRNLLTVTAPIGGLVYYGQATRGKWSQVATLDKALRPGGSVNPNQVIMSIVNPGPMSLLVDVPEDKLKDLSVGQEGHVVPKAFPDLKIPAKVESISLVPISPGTFDGQVKLMFDQRPERLVPGMAAEFVIELKDKE
ncbi:MAG: efflux RND transporter periplasmic adaptor subunit [Planctomycetaceae bacterium]|nr:efflux RND transporter periplasmic adaptor subunit [Planctomycetaceae bacterium]